MILARLRPCCIGPRQEIGRCRLLLCVSDGRIGSEGMGAAGGVTRDGRLLLRIPLVGRGGGRDGGLALHLGAGVVVVGRQDDDQKEQSGGRLFAIGDLIPIHSAD